MELTSNKYKKWTVEGLNTSEIAGRNIFTYIQSFPHYKEVFESILNSNGIRDIQPDKWYKAKDFLESLYELYSYASDSLFFDMGKNLVEIIGAHSRDISFKQALERLEKGHQEQHRGGNIGFHKVISYDEKNKKAKIESNTPYPSEFLRGIFSAFLNAYKPKNSNYVIIEAKNPKNIVKPDDESVFFDVSW